MKYEHDEVKWAVREWLKELDGVHADPTDLDVLGLANNEAKQKPSPKTTRHTEEIEMLTLLVAKIDVNVKAPAKEEGGGEKSKEVKALVEMYRSIYEPFKPNKTMVADFKMREENKNSTLTSRGYPLPAADKEEMQKQLQDLDKRGFIEEVPAVEQPSIVSPVSSDSRRASARHGRSR